MIYGYTYIDHDIQKFHKGMMYFFQKMIELDLGAYDENQLLEEWFRPLVNKSPAALLGEMMKIVAAYHDLCDNEKTEVTEAFENNQDIKEICEGNSDPKKYEHISNEAFRELLDEFFASLWIRIANKDDGINSKVVEECSTIMNHFGEFRKHSNHKTRICPFCGLNGFKPSFSPTRNAYDHYLPKAQYPFISVNFENLVPMCHDCNSDEKGADDTPFEGANRRVVYYPYDDTLACDHLEAVVIPNEVYDINELSTLLSDIDWNYDLKSNGNDDIRLTAWNDIFRLKGRYKEILIEYEQLWFSILIQDYSDFKASGKSFAEFRSELLIDLKVEFVRTERSTVHHSYINFLLNTDSIEEDLDLLTTNNSDK